MFLEEIVFSSYIELDFIAIFTILLISLVWIAYNKIMGIKLERSLYIVALGCILYFLSDIIWYILMSNPSKDVVSLSVVKGFIISSYTITSFAWFMYSCSRTKIFKNDFLVTIAFIPAFLLIVLVFTSQSSGIMFSIDENYNYVTTKLYYLFTLFTCMYYAFALLISAVKYFSNINKENSVFLVMAISSLIAIITTLISTFTSINVTSIGLTAAVFVLACHNIMGQAVNHKRVLAKNDAEKEQLNEINKIFDLLNNEDNYRDKSKHIINLINEYYAPERDFVFEIDKNTNTLYNSLEWKNDNFNDKTRLFKDVPLNFISPLLDYIKENDSFLLDSNSNDERIKEVFNRDLNKSNIKNISLIPSYQDNEIKSFIVFDNISKNMDRPLVFKTVSSLTKLNVMSKLEQSIVLKEEALNEKNQATSFADLFSKTYVSAYYANIVTGEYIIYRRTNYLEEKYNMYNDFYTAIKEYIKNDVCKEDQELMLSIIDPNYITDKLQHENEISVVIKDISNNQDKFYNFQIIRGTDKDHIALGFSDITELIKSREELIKVREDEKAIKHIKELNNVLDVMTYDYIYLFHLDFDSEKQDVYKKNDKYVSLIPSEVFGYKLEKRLRYYADNLVYSIDRKDFLENVNLENIQKNIAQTSFYVYKFRINIDGQIEWVELRSYRHASHKDHNCAIFGIRIATVETEKAEELKKEMDKIRNYSIIETIGSDYVCVDYVTIGTDMYSDYVETFRTSDKLKEIAPNLDEYKLFYERMELFENKVVRKEDREAFRKDNGRDKVISALNKNGIYYVNYVLNVLGRDYHYQLKYVSGEKDENGNVKTFVVALHNIEEEFTKEIEIENKLHDAWKQAELANKAKTNFLFSMSHDIRTPMNAIIGYTSMAKKNITNTKETEKCLNKINIASEQLLDLINEVLDMSRIESGKLEFVNDEVNIVDKTNDSYSILANLANEKKIEYNINTKKVKDKFVICDSKRLSQILVNVLSNAIKYTNVGGKIDLTLEEIKSLNRGAATYKFTCQDNGIGMSPEFLKKIFTEFERERNTTVSNVAGTGLGMSIVKKLIDHMNGTINIESEPNKGTKVEIVLSFEVIGEIEKDESKAELLNAASKIYGARVLLVEDNEMNREIATDLLTNAGVKVEEACNGLEAVNKVKNSTPGYFKAVLMDIQMPVMDGYEASREIRKLEDANLKDIPIIAMSANAFSEDKINALNAGINDYIVKPVDAKVLYKVIASNIK